MKHLTLSHRLSLKERNIARMDADDEYVPVSARVAFKLQAWKEAEESTEFTTLTTETNTIVKAFQLNLKEKIIKNIKLECDVLRVKIRQELCESLFSVVELYLEALGSEPQFTHEIVLASLQANCTALLRHVPGTVQDFTILYCTVHNVPTETHTTTGMVRPHDIIRRSLISVIARTWEIYLKQQKDNELFISLCNKAKEALQTQATEEAAIELDTELTVSNQALQDLIQREATSQIPASLRYARKSQP
jgi:hypothetical protein